MDGQGLVAPPQVEVQLVDFDLLILVNIGRRIYLKIIVEQICVSLK